MAVEDRKSAVLTVLSRAHAPLRLSEILARLPDAPSERTVRRWLVELVRDSHVVKTGKTRATRYRARLPAPQGLPSPDAGNEPRPHVVARHQATDETRSEQGVFSPASLTALAHVRRPLFERRPIAYNADWLDSYRPNRTFYLHHSDRTRMAERGRRTVSSEPAGTYAKRIYSRLLIDLSYNSSRLEGNTYSLLDTQRLVMEGASADGRLDEETTMILNHKEAIRHLVDRAASIEVTYDEVLTLHYLLSDGLVPPQHAGGIRDYGVRVDGSTFVPLEGQDRLASQMTAVTSKASEIDDPFEQSLFLLVHIAYVQAFADVNKRTSRLCANIPLVRHNLVPLSFNSVATDDYASAIVAVYELNDTGPIADLYRASYFRTCMEYNATAQALGFDEIRVRYRQQRRRMVAHIVRELLTGDALEAYLESDAPAQVPPESRDHFLTTIREDLTQLSPARLAGLGVTRQQFGRWLART
ncbi:MAG: hypothetical protein F4Y86_19215 [Gammaproteobacteria bacterium]|nr:hypothetical protein [Gammaproteobacteria bacterium]MYB39575.1 hypothetical protein [Gammaproteobacteria bacterium]